MLNVVCLTGPSGVGKTSYANRLCQLEGFVTPQVVTTRKKRGDDGDHYIYVTDHEFQELVVEDVFLEHDSYMDYRYGTLRFSDLKQNMGVKWVVLDLTPAGVRQVKSLIPDAIVIIVLPDDPRWLYARLRERGTQNKEEIEARELILESYLEMLSELDGTRVFASYHPNTWDRTFAELLEVIGVVVD